MIDDEIIKTNKNPLEKLHFFYRDSSFSFKLFWGFEISRKSENDDLDDTLLKQWQSVDQKNEKNSKKKASPPFPGSRLITPIKNALACTCWGISRLVWSVLWGGIYHREGDLIKSKAFEGVRDLQKAVAYLWFGFFERCQKDLNTTLKNIDFHQWCYKEFIVKKSEDVKKMTEALIKLNSDAKVQLKLLTGEFKEYLKLCRESNVYTKENSQSELNQQEKDLNTLMRNLKKSYKTLKKHDIAKIEQIKKLTNDLKDTFKKLDEKIGSNLMFYLCNNDNFSAEKPNLDENDVALFVHHFGCKLGTALDKNKKEIQEQNESGLKEHLKTMENRIEKLAEIFPDHHNYIENQNGVLKKCGGQIITPLQTNLNTFTNDYVRFFPQKEDVK